MAKEKLQKTGYKVQEVQICTTLKENNFHSLLSKATSGQEFSGLEFRTFPPHLRKFHDDTMMKVKKMLQPKWNCTKWGVVTTIFSPPNQEAVRRFLYRTDWCIVVVGDIDKPKVSSHILTMISVKYFFKSCVNL